MSSTISRRHRGYALMFVLGIALALGIIIAGLFSFLADSVSSGKQAQEELQQLYGCDGALRLAIDEVKRSGNVDIAKLQENLRTLSTALKTDINPRTGRPFADIEAITAVEEDTEVGQVSSDPFFGMQFVRQGSSFEVTANPEASRGRVCRAQSPNRLRTISYFEFARVSGDVLEGFTGATSETTGDIYTLEHTTPLRRFFTPGGRRNRTPSGGFTVNAIRIADNETFRPVSPSGQPWSFINKKKKFFGGTKRRTRHKKPIVEYFTKWPTNTPTIDPTLSRFAMQADIRIVDGLWYMNDRSFPGLCTWSDRPDATSVCAKDRVVNAKLSFSPYETDGGFAQGGAAIVRYGITAEVPGSGPHAGEKRPFVANICSGDPGYAIDEGDGAHYACASGPDPNMASFTGEQADPLIAAAGMGFFDPYLGDDNKKTPILPIVLDVAALGAAMNTAIGNGDLGDLRCLSEDNITCPNNRRFAGSLWIGTLPAGMFANGTPIQPGIAQALPNGTATIPCPLHNTATGCVRPNAVVITNADDLQAFTATGLSIASNLPMYVVGNVNNATPEALRTSRIALLAPSITALSSNFNFEQISFLNESGTAADVDETLRWSVSIFSSWALDRGLFTAARDPSRHILRKLQPRVNVNVTGSMVAMFRRSDYDKIQKFNTGNGSFSSPTDDLLVKGIPTFEVNDKNRTTEPFRMASGLLRFPGEDGRDLRRAKFDHQPPGSPRFSIDPAPIDRR